MRTHKVRIHLYMCVLILLSSASPAEVDISGAFVAHGLHICAHRVFVLERIERVCRIYLLCVSSYIPSDITTKPHLRRLTSVVRLWRRQYARIASSGEP
jgi:hypothetical protein